MKKVNFNADEVIRGMDQVKKISPRWKKATANEYSIHAECNRYIDISTGEFYVRNRSCSEEEVSLDLATFDMNHWMIDLPAGNLIKDTYCELEICGDCDANQLEYCKSQSVLNRAQKVIDAENEKATERYMTKDGAEHVEYKTDPNSKTGMEKPIIAKTESLTIEQLIERKMTGWWVENIDGDKLQATGINFIQGRKRNYWQIELRVFGKENTFHCAEPPLSDRYTLCEPPENYPGKVEHVEPEPKPTNDKLPVAPEEGEIMKYIYILLGLVLLTTLSISSPYPTTHRPPIAEIHVPDYEKKVCCRNGAVHVIAIGLTDDQEKRLDSLFFEMKDILDNIKGDFK